MAGADNERESVSREGCGPIGSVRQKRLQLEATIKRALQSASLAQLQALAELAAAVDGHAPGDLTPRERVLAMRHSRDEEMLDELQRHEREGRKREAAMLVAKQFAVDPRDPTEVESLASRARRLRRRPPRLARP